MDPKLSRVVLDGAHRGGDSTARLAWQQARHLLPLHVRSDEAAGEESTCHSDDGRGRRAARPRVIVAGAGGALSLLQLVQLGVGALELGRLLLHWRPTPKSRRRFTAHSYTDRHYFHETPTHRPVTRPRIALRATEPPFEIHSQHSPSVISSLMSDHLSCESSSRMVAALGRSAGRGAQHRRASAAGMRQADGKTSGVRLRLGFRVRPDREVCAARVQCSVRPRAYSAYRRAPPAACRQTKPAPQTRAASAGPHSRVPPTRSSSHRAPSGRSASASTR
eukprot:1741296-Prymnesium_polylepis.2